MERCLGKPLVDVTVEKSAVSHKVRLLLFPYNIQLQKVFGTSHSQTTQRQNALSVLIVDAAPEFSARCYGVSEAGLPPKKKNVYEADLQDLQEYFENFCEAFARFANQGSAGTELPYLFGQLEEYFTREKDSMHSEFMNDDGTSLSTSTFRLLFKALDECKANNDKAKTYIRCGKSLVESLIFDTYCTFRGVSISNVFSIPDENDSHQTFYTAALNPDIDEIVKAAAFGRGHTKNLKIKLNQDVEMTRKILHRLDSATELRGSEQDTQRNWSIDANCSWTPKTCEQMLNEVLIKYKDRIYMVEQPFPVDFLEQDLETQRLWASVKEMYNTQGIKIFADESMRNAEDVGRLAPYVDGVNIKLEKCGGYREAFKAVRAAQSQGLLIWFGCMVGSNLNSTATSHMFSLACCSDLDGALLVTDQSKLFHGGFQFKNSSISLPIDTFGVGVIAKGAFSDELKALNLMHFDANVNKQRPLGDYLADLGLQKKKL